MEIAQKYIEIVHKRGIKKLPLKKVYGNILKRELFLVAYGKLYANKGATTKGVDPSDTVDGMSVERIDKIIDKLKNRMYQWQPARRTGIPKKDGKSRPLSLPGWNDKMVQEVLRMVFEAYYEPKFSNHSHGFRPNRGCHTALAEIGKWKGTKWFIEGDIKGCFDNIDHDILLNIIRRDIQDRSLLNLLKKMLKAGYTQNWKYHNTYSGTPQGGIVSPILANIILNELVEYIEKQLIPQYTRGETRERNPEYEHLKKEIQEAQRKKQIELCRKLKQQRRRIPAGDTYDPDFRRLKYIRYADDFILGLIGPKSEALEIKEKIRQFLQTIKFTLSDEKTLITHATDSQARFLSYEINMAHNNNQLTQHRKQAKLISRAINGRPIFRVPKDIISEWCNSVSKNGKVVHKPYLMECSDYEIALTYEMEFRGLANYYSFAHNVSALQKVRHYYMMSLAKTIAVKHKQNITWVFAKYRGKSQYGISALIVEVPNPNNPDKPLITTFGGKPLRRNANTIIKDNKAYLYHGRNELVRRLLANECELCGSSEKIVGHHVRKLADVKKKFKGQKQPPKWVVFMMATQ